VTAQAPAPHVNRQADGDNLRVANEATATIARWATPTVTISVTSHAKTDQLRHLKDRSHRPNVTGGSVSTSKSGKTTLGTGNAYLTVHVPTSTAARGPERPAQTAR